tara:strand:+ start:370 stop:588 length:219 start_codon:yes stop_codon:yes gene_type:complete
MQNKNKFKEGDLVNLRYGTPGEEDQLGCLVVKWWMSSRPYGLPSQANYHVLLPNGRHAAVAEEYLELCAGAR